MYDVGCTMYDWKIRARCAGESGAGGAWRAYVRDTITELARVAARANAFERSQLTEKNTLIN